METEGIIRRIDKLGRIVIPMEIRKKLNWDICVPLEISVFGRYVLICEKSNVFSPVIPRKVNPIRRKIDAAINVLSDADLLLTLEILRRFND